MSLVSPFSPVPASMTIRRSCHGFLVLLAVASPLLIAGPAAAQDKSSDTSSTKTAPAGKDGDSDPQVQSIRQKLGDISLLNPLAPLALTQKQIDALIDAVKESAAMSAEVKQQDNAALKALADEVDKARADNLKGVPVSADFAAHIVAAQKASDDRLSAARLKAIKTLTVALDSTLTPTQKDAVEAWSEKVFGGKRIPKKYQANPSSAPKEEVQALALAALAEQSFLNDRTLELLRQYKPAPASEAASSAAPPAADKQ